MKMLTVAELIRYRMAHERYVHRVGEALVDTRFGEFRLIAYESEVDGGESHVALIKGDIDKTDDDASAGAHARPLPDGRRVRRDRLRMPRHARRLAPPIAQEGRGALIYLHQTSQGILRGENRRTQRAQLPSRPQAAVTARQRAPDAARDRNRRADSFRPEPAPHPPADQSAQSVPRSKVSGSKSSTRFRWS